MNFQELKRSKVDVLKGGNMVNFKRIIGFTFVLLLTFSSAGLVACFSEEVTDYTLSTDARLSEPKESFRKGLEFMDRGGKELRRRPGQAQKYYEHAEDYFLKAAFMYRELGQKHGIDTSAEVSLCNNMQRKAHVKVSKARRARKRAGSNF